MSRVGRSLGSVPITYYITISVTITAKTLAARRPASEE